MTMIALNDLSRHHAPLRAALDAAIARVQDRGHYILGPEVEAFEREFAAYCGAASCVAWPTAPTRWSSHCARSISAPATTSRPSRTQAATPPPPIRAVGATPLYVDIDEGTLLMDPDSLARRITPRTRAVVVTHLYGRLADIDAIAAVANARGAALIEDCAQAHGARHGTRTAGNVGAPSAASASTRPRTWARSAMAGPSSRATPRWPHESGAPALRLARQVRVEVEGGRNSRLDELQAAVLRVKLPHARCLECTPARDRVALRRRQSPTRGSCCRRSTPKTSAHLYVVRAKSREPLRAHLAEAGVATDVHYPVPDHGQAAWSGDAPATGLRAHRPCVRRSADAAVLP